MASPVKTDSAEALLKQLKDPFDPKLVKWRTGGGSKQLAYIDARDVMKRLDTVLGAENYQTKYVAVDGGFLCELSLRLNGAWLTRSDGANTTKIEPIKGGISSALKRAANAWGIGRYLYYLNPNKFNANNTDSWPKWALPGEQVEDWEDIAELEADASTGMDEAEAGETFIEALDQVRAATSVEELTMLTEGFDKETQIKLAGETSKKLNELLHKQNG